MPGKKTIRRAIWIFGAVIGLPMMSLMGLGASYVILRDVPGEFEHLGMMYSALGAGVEGVGLFDVAEEIGAIIGAVIVALLTGAFGLWLPYHAIFGDHQDQWPR
jgi:hypothetical protein